MWEDGTVKCSGVRFVVLSSKMLHCHHGVDRNTTVKNNTKKIIKRKRYLKRRIYYCILLITTVKEIGNRVEKLN